MYKNVVLTLSNWMFIFLVQSFLMVIITPKYLKSYTFQNISLLLSFSLLLISSINLVFFALICKSTFLVSISRVISLYYPMSFLQDVMLLDHTYNICVAI